MEDQPVKIVDEVGECELGLCTRKADGANERKRGVELSITHKLNG
jgi:hypothetical protein